MPALAQNDSLYTDTVVIVKPPVIIQQQVHVTVPDSSHHSVSWEVGLYYSIQKNVASSNYTVTGLFQSSGMQVKAHLGQVEIGTALGIMATHVTYPSQSHTDIFPAPDRKETVTYPTDTFETTNGNVTTVTIHYQTDTIIYTNQTYDITTYSQEQKTPTTYLQIPLSIGYRFPAGPWYITPSLQLIYNKRIGSASENSLQKNHFWMAGGQLNVGRSLFRHLEVELYAQFRSNITPIYSDIQLEGVELQKENWKLLGIGFGLNYHF